VQVRARIGATNGRLQRDPPGLPAMHVEAVVFALHLMTNLGVWLVPTFPRPATPPPRTPPEDLWTSAMIPGQGRRSDVSQPSIDQQVSQPVDSAREVLVCRKTVGWRYRRTGLGWH
jgi:hypothetical protein